MASDMGFENLLAAVRIDLQFGGDQGGGARRPLHPGVAFAPGERKDR
jgi:hypothetical protein